MKKLILLFGLFALLLISSCSKDEIDVNIITTEPTDSVNVDPEVNNNSLLLLEVDYTTNTFLGGKEYTFTSSVKTDTVPVKAFYISPCDFGELVVRFEPTQDTIFNGVIKWQHAGEVITPQQLAPASDFELSTSAARTRPDDSQFQAIFIDEHCYPSSFREIWEPLSMLKTTSNYFNPEKKIGIFLYTPGVGYADDQLNKHKDEWKWFIIMYK